MSLISQSAIRYCPQVDKRSIRVVTPRVKNCEESEAVRWVQEWFALPILDRILIGVCLAVGAIGGIYGGHTLIQRYGHSWVAWLIAIIILEPIGLTCALGLLIPLLPQRFVSGIFSETLRRARLAAGITGLTFACVGVVSIGTLLLGTLYNFWLSGLRWSTSDKIVLVALILAEAALVYLLVHAIVLLFRLGIVLRARNHERSKKHP